MTTYRLLKFLHLASVTLWIGGSFGMAVLIRRVARMRDRAVLASLLRQAGLFGRSVVAPASLVTLASGLGMLAVVGLRPDQALWVQWGFAGILTHFILGGWFIRRAAQRLGSLAVAPESTEAGIQAASRRLGLLNALYLSLLLSVIGAMALKPSF